MANTEDGQIAGESFSLLLSMIWLLTQSVITTTRRRFPLKLPPKCSVLEMITVNVKEQEQLRNQESHAENHRLHHQQIDIF